MFGAAQRIGEEIEKSVLEPAEDGFRLKLVESLRKAMREPDLNDPIAEGRRLSVADALELALAAPERRPAENGHAHARLRPVAKF